MLNVSCRRCGMSYHADDSHAGNRLQCIRCGKIIELGGPFDLKRKLFIILLATMVVLLALLVAAYLFSDWLWQLDQPEDFPENSLHEESLHRVSQYGEQVRVTVDRGERAHLTNIFCTNLVICRRSPEFRLWKSAVPRVQSSLF